VRSPTLTRGLSQHEVKTVAEVGWAGVKNGALLQLAATAIRCAPEYQQNFSGLTIAIVVIVAPSNDIDVLRPFMPSVREALLAAKSGVVSHVHG
jgi:hypothetical protein